jgi:SAM-dependent methyltransferase
MVAFLQGEDRKEDIFRAVSDMYAQVATSPTKVFHFPTGRLACLFVGYPKAQLDDIPEIAVESFSGVGYPFEGWAIREGDHVLDVGAGSGTDVLIATKLAGRHGRVWGLDMTPVMLEKAQSSAARMGVSRVKFLEGNAEEIPLPDGSVDVVMSNGVYNLVPDKLGAFSEIFRVLRPGGRIQISDIVLSRPILAKSRNNPRLWAGCIAGAVLEQDYVETLLDAGFKDVSVIRRLDYFSKSSNPVTREVAAFHGAISVTLRGSR